ncbi:HEAT repeat domain-containing protein [Dactylosporangium sp. NPDC051541]|uniref:HEAT repeat domain-containing protein n=1 Tax=Dactylosporangium sp. NPDC051541 TaxID=3363977 RepID=UPI00379F3FE7
MTRTQETQRAELEASLARHVAAGDIAARDRTAHALATTYGAAVLPALLRALVTDRNDDGETLQLDVLQLFEAAPDVAHARVLECLAAAEPGLRRVGVWGLSVMFRAGDIALVVAAADDPAAEVRAEVVGALGSAFGGSDPRVEPVVMAGARDPDAEVRCAAVMALWSMYGPAATAMLVTCAGDPDPRVRHWVAWALQNRTEPTARAALERLAADDNDEVRFAARGETA